MLKNEDLETHAEVTGLAIWYWIVGLFMLIAGTTVVLWMKPVWLGFEREAAVESHQYIEARKTEVITDIQKHDELTTNIAKFEGNDKVVSGLKSQQKSLEHKIQAALSKIPKDEWPAGTERFAP